MLRNGTRVPNGCFTAVKHPAKWGFGCENGISYALGISQSFRSCETRSLCCKMALVYQEVVSQLRKFSQRGAWGCKNHFATEWQFCNEGLISQRTFWGYEIISQQRGDFARASFGLRNFADQYFSLAFKFLLAPSDLPSISLQFLLHEIIQKD